MGAGDTSTEESGTQPGAGDTSAEESGPGREDMEGYWPFPGGTGGGGQPSSAKFNVPSSGPGGEGVICIYSCVTYSLGRYLWSRMMSRQLGIEVMWHDI
jgi:hypothetical protein